MNYPVPNRVPLPTPRPDFPQRPMPPQMAPLPPQRPMPQQQGGGLMGFLRDNSQALGAMSAGLLSGRTGPEQFGRGIQGFTDARASAREKHEEKKRKNATLEWLRQNAPEYAGAVEQGVLNAGDAYKMHLEAKKPKGFEPTDDIREYEFARSQGFEGSFQDFMTAMKKAGATNINMPGQPNIGSIPQGYEAIQDPQSNAWSMRPIPGGPEDTTKHEAAKTHQEAQKATVARQAIRGIREKIDRGGLFNLPETGVVGSRLSGINQEAADVKNHLATLQSVVSFDRLQAMREASPTGGALGAVSERELALLQASLGALSQDSSPEQLRQTLDFIDGIMAKFEAYPSGAQNAGSTPMAAPSGRVQSYRDYF